MNTKKPRKPRKPRGQVPPDWVQLFSQGQQLAMPWAFPEGEPVALALLEEPEPPRTLPD